MSASRYKQIRQMPHVGAANSRTSHLPFVWTLMNNHHSENKPFISNFLLPELSGTIGLTGPIKHWAECPAKKQDNQHTLFTSRVSGRGHRIGAVCVCVCVSVCALTTEPFDVRTRNFTWNLICVCLTIHNKKGLWGKRTVQLGIAGGTWTLRRFHFKRVWISDTSIFRCLDQN